MAILQTATQFQDGDRLTAQMATDMVETAVSANTNAQAAKNTASSALSHAQTASNNASAALVKAQEAYDLASAIQTPSQQPTTIEVTKTLKNDIY